MTRRSEYNLQELDDAALVRLCVEGDEDALTALVHRYQRLVYSIPLRYGLREEAAADIFQAVWLRLIEKLPSIRDPRTISGWLITTTKRECWRSSRRARREAPIGEGGDSDEISFGPEPVDPGQLDEEQIRLELQQRVRSAVALLPDRCRRIIEVFFYQDEPLSYAEAARLLGMSGGSLGPTRARCLEKLRRIMDRFDGPDDPRG
jgi:RNA polymerase sigma factor (sigma-70 family)